jgi:hypothetical protein
MMRSLDRTTKALALVASLALAVASGCVAEPEGTLEESAAAVTGDPTTDMTAGQGTVAGQGTIAAPGADQGFPQMPAPQAAVPPMQAPPLQAPVQQPIQQPMQQPVQQPVQQQPVQQQPVQQQPVQGGVLPVGAPVGAVPFGIGGPIGVGCAGGIGCFGAQRAFVDDNFWNLPGGFLYGLNPLTGPLVAYPAWEADFFGPFNGLP